jgi:ferredoxin
LNSNDWIIKKYHKENIMSEKIEIDQEECIGCQACVELCPSVFAFDDDAEKAYVLDDADAGADCVDEAIASCPAECISKE